MSSCKKEQLKLHRSLIGVKGGGGATIKQPSDQPSLQHLAVKLKINFLGQILVQNTTSQQILFENVCKHTINIL